MVSGILNVNKPPGMTSFAVVSLVRKLTGVRRVGHAGTLDPIADGVLPICLGQATRVVEYIVGAPKAYRALIHLGAATDTYDIEGTVTATGDASAVSRQDVERELGRFAGDIPQLPPMYSALKHKGKPLYRYARAGKTVPREERLVTIYRLDLLRFEPPLVEVEMEVGRGAYVRTLAHDLGERLGCQAHLQGLTRLRSGPFTVETAVGLDQLREAAEAGNWEDLLYPADRVLESWHAAILGEEHSREALQGRLLSLAPLRPELLSLEAKTPCRAYSDDGLFLAILRYQGAGNWRPEKVFGASQ
jgi:tRNA pseudouridine55 synthase